MQRRLDLKHKGKAYIDRNHSELSDGDHVVMFNIFVVI